MKVAIVQDNKINKWSLQRVEPLADRIDLRVFVGERNDYPVEGIHLPKRFLTHREEIALACRSPRHAWIRFWKNRFPRCDYYYHSLRKHLARYDIVHSTDLTRSAYTLASLKKELGFCLVLNWWQNIPFSSLFDSKSAFMRDEVVEAVDCFLPFTHSAKQALVLEGIPEEKVCVIYPGVHLKGFSPEGRGVEAKRRLGIPEGPFVVAYVGKLVSYKGVHDLVTAAALLKAQRGQEFLFVLAGRGAQRSLLETRLRRWGLTACVRFLDFLPYEEVPTIYRAADVLVLPSYPTMTWQEQFGFVLVEAMACGTPVIGAASGAIPEIVGDAGLLFSPGDCQTLAALLLDLSRDRDRQRELGERGRARVEQCFDSQKNAEQLHQVYLEVIDGRGDKRRLC